MLTPDKRGTKHARVHTHSRTNKPVHVSTDLVQTRTRQWGGEAAGCLLSVE